MTADLAEFLLARIAEDEAVALEAAKDGLPVRGRSRWEWQQLSSKPNTSLIALPDEGTGLQPMDVIRDDRVSSSVANHIARQDPARVLAECEAKRRIVELHGNGDAWCDHCAGHSRASNHCPTIQLLALPYADHPDCREQWAPPRRSTLIENNFEGSPDGTTLTARTDAE